MKFSGKRMGAFMSLYTYIASGAAFRGFILGIQYIYCYSQHLLHSKKVEE